jgi:hypothetical protein
MSRARVFFRNNGKPLGMLGTLKNRALKFEGSRNRRSRSERRSTARQIQSKRTEFVCPSSTGPLSAGSESRSTARHILPAILVNTIYHLLPAISQASLKLKMTSSFFPATATSQRSMHAVRSPPIDPPFIYTHHHHSQLSLINNK